MKDIIKVIVKEKTPRVLQVRALNMCMSNWRQSEIRKYVINVTDHGLGQLLLTTARRREASSFWSLPRSAMWVKGSWTRYRHIPSYECLHIRSVAYVYNSVSVSWKVIDNMSPYVDVCNDSCIECYVPGLYAIPHAVWLTFWCWFGRSLRLFGLKPECRVRYLHGFILPSG